MKILLYAFVAIIAICLINLWYQVYIVGQYYVNAGLFFTIMLGMAPLVVIYGSYLLIKYIKNY